MYINLYQPQSNIRFDDTISYYLKYIYTKQKVKHQMKNHHYSNTFFSMNIYYHLSHGYVIIWIVNVMVLFRVDLLFCIISHLNLKENGHKFYPNKSQRLCILIFLIQCIKQTFIQNIYWKEISYEYFLKSKYFLLE